MTIKEKLEMNRDGLVEHGPITIAAFGDSVTHGAFGAGEIDFDHVYHRILAQKIAAVRPYIPVNVINAGIGGLTAKQSLGRMESQVFSHHPDLVIVAFGLNDVNGTLDDYIGSLRTIFSQCIARGIETVYLTPNMLNTYVAEDTAERDAHYAQITAEYQNSGKMDAFIDAARTLATDMGVKIADAYAQWKKRAETEDTTLLLANRINHPSREMHRLFADLLFAQIFDTDLPRDAKTESTMYRP